MAKYNDHMVRFNTDLSRPPVLEDIASCMSESFGLETPDDSFIGVLPSEHLLPDAFRNEYLLREVTRKVKDLNPGLDQDGTAWSKFVLTEVACCETNDRLASAQRWFGDSRFTIETDDKEMNSVMRKARGILKDILGPLYGPTSLLGDGESTSLYGIGYFRHGEKACSEAQRAKGASYLRLTRTPTVTMNCGNALASVVRRMPFWASGFGWSGRVTGSAPGEGTDFSITAGARTAFVPKDWKTSRVIAIEPSGNLFLQKAIGNRIRERMRRAVITTSVAVQSVIGFKFCDLNDQVTNQKLAQIGSAADGCAKLATIDLSSASDTVSTKLCELLLPQEWFSALMVTRSPTMSDPYTGRVRYLEKVASMGNGWTWELESALFYALSRATVEHLAIPEWTVSTYGDDIIINTEAVPLLFRVLSYCGFEVNEKKSHHTGSFRESCGKHYFKGHDVTPFYIRRRPKTLEDVIAIHNRVVEWSFHRDCKGDIVPGYFRDSRMAGVLKLLLKCVPNQHKDLVVPIGFGDGGFIRTAPVQKKRIRKGKENHTQAWFAVHFTPSVTDARDVHKLSDEQWYVHALYSMAFGYGDLSTTQRFGHGDLLANDQFTERRVMQIQLENRYRKVKAIVFTTWHSPGPWI